MTESGGGPISDAGIGGALAIDLSGPGIAVGLISAGGEIPTSQRIPVRDVGAEDPEAVFAALCSAIGDVLHASGFDPEDAGGPGDIGDIGGIPGTAGIRGIGVTVTGDHDRTSGTVSPEGIPAWRRFGLRDRLAERYGSDVRIVADGVAMTVAEHWRGAARGRRNVAGIVAAESLSGGLILGGALIAGTTGNAGQIGHVCVDPAGPPCSCGALGCLQAVAGASAIARWSGGRPGSEWIDPAAHQVAARDAADSSRAARVLGRIAEAAWSGDPAAVTAFRRAGEAIGTAVAIAVTLLDLDAVVVGGALAAAGPVLFDPIADGYRRHAALDYAALPRVVPGVLGGEAMILGAGAVVLHPEQYWPYPD